MDRDGVSRYIVTDVSRDGTLTGPNVELLTRVAAKTPAPVIASGGISELKDLTALAETGVIEGSIVGKALYAGRFTLPEALAAVR
jgi:phosphoribosylanthranilate isomerase